LAVSLAAINLSASQGAAVLGLLERASVPPLPSFYRLLYDYVSGVGGLMSNRVGDILEEGEAVGDKLYAEFVAPYENNEAIDRAIARITSRLKTLELLIGESTVAAERHAMSLRRASAEFASAELDPMLLRDWIVRLEAANRTLRRTNGKLEEELKDAALELEATRSELEDSRESSKRDALTGLANRAGLDFAFRRLIETMGSHGTSLSCAVVDIDHFKALNDTYGHPVGDEVLRIATRALLASVRPADIVGRSGGDEFIVVLPGADLSAAHSIGDNIRAAIASSDVQMALGQDTLGGITASVGVAQYRPGDTAKALIDRADRCLYRAKQNGRNRVESVSDPTAQYFHT
jgi:diguanylate cyclase